MPARTFTAPGHQPDRPSGQHLAPAGRGRALPRAVQAKMEAALGHDFSAVRIHEGGHAESLGAIAYTRGRDIHFAPGRYSPQSRTGQELLGHELAHVVQQSHGRVALPQGNGAPINADPGLEAEADRLGRAAARGHSPAGFTVTPARASGEGGGPVQRSRVIQPVWGKQRVYGHQPIGEHNEEEGGVVAQIRDAVSQAQDDRRQRKREILANVYRERAKFGPDDDKDVIRKKVGGEAFLGSLFGQKGSYLPDLKASKVTSDKILAKLNIEGLEAVDDAENRQTQLHYKGKHVYTLHRGASAFVEAGTTTAGRRKFTKHGSDKKYVADDRGTPTRRFAYGVKDAHQVGLATGTGLVGRHVSLRRKPILTALPSEHELVGLPKQKGLEVPLSVDQALFLHQEHGSSNSQRGVSLASTEYPLLSNAARGFADAKDAGTRKLRVDLGKVPVAAPEAAPNLINYYQKIPGFRQHRVEATEHKVQVGRGSRTIKKDKAQQHFDWSTSKNRELFLRELLPGFVKGQKTPSPLEDQTYDPGDVEELLRNAKGQQYNSP